MLAFFTRHRAAILVLGVGLGIRLPLVFLPPSHIGAVWRATDTASIARNFLRNGYQLLYPQINWGGAGPGYVESEFQLYPFLVSLLYGAVGEHFWLGRLVSLAFTLGACLLFHRLARRLCGADAAVWALGFFVGTPLYLRYSVQFMPEASLLFFYLGALVAFLEWLDHRRPWSAGLAAASTALAILVKPTALHIGLAFLLMLVRRRGWRALADWRLGLFGAACLVPPTTWYLHARQLYLEYGNTFGILSGGDSKFGRVLEFWTSMDFYVSLVTLELRTILSYGGVVFLAIGAAVLLRRDRSGTFLFGSASVAISYMLIPRYSIFADYYHLYSVPFTCLAVGAGARWLACEGTASPWRRALRAALAVVLIGLVLAHQVLFYRDLLSRRHYDPTCASLVGKVVPQGDRIVVSSTGREFVDGIPNNYQNPALFYFSDRFGWSLPLEHHDAEHVEALRQQGARYVVVQNQKLHAEQWEFVDYLLGNASQVGPGIEERCAIYRFADRPGSGTGNSAP